MRCVETSLCVDDKADGQVGKQYSRNELVGVPVDRLNSDFLPESTDIDSYI